MIAGMKEAGLRATRLVDGPIVSPTSHPSIGANIQGPSLIRVPDWVSNALGRYYLYFADHKGSYIRLAYADALTGPWRIHVPGSLHLAHSPFPNEPPPISPEQLRAAEERMRKSGRRIGHSVREELTTPHVASPDVHVDDAGKRIVMYYHGLEAAGVQVTRAAVSHDGIAFECGDDVLGRTYMRVFEYGGATYALAMPGQFYRMVEPLRRFEEGPLLFNPDMRHAAVLVRNETLYVFWTQVGDAPERILLSTIDLGGDWLAWTASEPTEVLRPERAWEGANAPLEPSFRSVAYGVVNQLRDPAVYVEGERAGRAAHTYLLYAVGGESGIGIARIDWSQ